MSEQSNSEFNAIDNIILNAPVVVDPDDLDDAMEVAEPSSLAIFGFATMALGWTVRQGDIAPGAALVCKVKKC